MTDPHIEQARHLFEIRRYAEAEKSIKQSLSLNPQNDAALAMLALCYLAQDRAAEAVHPAQQAVGLEPNDAFNLYVLGKAYFLTNQSQLARTTLTEALQVAPTAPFLHLALAQIEYHESRWELALYSANKGLEFDPEDQELINYRTMALVKLNRTAEAESTVEYGMHNNPENTMTHANKGWVSIEKGKYDEAVAAFKEALRLNPNNEYARAGLKESIKGKNWLYRGLLRYFLWMSKFSEKSQWAIMIGAYIFFRALRYLSVAYPAMAPFLMPLIYAYIIFALSTWFARPVSNLALRLHPLGKFALTDDEIKGSNYAGGFLAGTVVLVLLGLGLGSETFLQLGIACGLMLIPIGGTFNSEPGGKARRQLTFFSIVLFSLGIVLPVLALLLNNERLWNLGTTGFGIGIFAFSWIGSSLVMRESKRF